MRVILGTLLCFFFDSFAMAQTHKGISFQGVVKLPSGEYPTRSGVSVVAQILSANDCVLREERFSGVNLSNGYINLVIGNGTTLGYDPGLTLKQVMDNSKVISSLTCLNSDGGVNSGVTTFNPATGSGVRKLRINFTIDSTPIIADFNMRAVSYSVHSESSDEAKSLDGKSASQFIQTSAQVTQTALENLLSNTALGQILSGSYSAPTSTSATTAQGLDSSYIVPLTQGGTGATSASAARTNLGLGTLATVSPSGTPDGTKYLRDDGTWATVTGGVSSVAGRGGDVTLSASDISNFNAATDARIGALQASTSLGGDLSGTLPNPNVVKLNGQALSATGTLAGQVLRYAGGNTWTPAFISMFDLRSTTTGAQAFGGVGCTSKQTLTWTSATDNLSCSDIAIESSQVSGLAASATTDTTNATNISSGTLNVNRLPSSVTNTLWSEGSSGSVYRNSGNVGIGIEPAAKLHVDGEINVNNNKITNVALPTNPNDVATKSYVDASAGGSSSCPVSGGATYFTEGGNPSFCRQSTLSSGGAFVFTNVNTGATCAPGKVCKDGSCIAASACTGATAIGTACGSGGVYAGSFNGSNYMVMPSGCNNSTTPSCGGSDSLTLQWAGYSGVAPTNTTTATSVSDGYANTVTLATYGLAYAALYCKNLNYGGFTDWFLPSQNELNYLFTVRASLPSFAAGNYWSSTDRAFESAWWQNMSSGTQGYGYHDGWSTYINNPKSASSYVRCVRKF